jgi:transposase
VHAACNQEGKPLRFFITKGQRSDYTQALSLLAGKPMKVLIADKGYDANYMLEAGEKVGAKVVIPPRKNRKIQREYDKELYKERNIIERMFSKNGVCTKFCVSRKIKHIGKRIQNYHKIIGIDSKQGAN